MKIHLIKAAVLTSLDAVCGYGLAEAQSITQLDIVYVEANCYTNEELMPEGKMDRQIHFGIYENIDFMEAPANIASYTNKPIQQSYIPGRTFINTISNNPFVLNHKGL